ncbi:MAG: 16S rRNA (cytosine(1402)-N(4))-methyltransferase RsmH [Candidatus Nomurabacteria bacterium]|jgi:16S rRNA (cytosine1402-N4)-methyltransferase|nr:16S rRNA (cytosine(1402)-N(4))-methyltransferase RsmH [Candidatus Nomurabacteria bacterium]
MKLTPQQLHIPALLRATARFLRPEKSDRYLDLTAGYGGHALEIITATGDARSAVLIDRDEDAIKVLRKKFPQSRLLHSDFLAAARELVRDGEKFDMILADFGVSSPQLDMAERGFSFMRDGPLDMRMDGGAGETAAELIGRLKEKALTDIIIRFGEEKPKLAARIAKALKRGRPTTTVQAAKIIARQYGGGYHKIHPATRTFQALRIAVNDELGQIDETLRLLPELLADGGRVAIISFHSLEDRLVKQFFKEHSEAGYEADLEILTKKAIRGDTEDVNNPRARSAKLRVARKIKKPTERRF